MACGCEDIERDKEIIAHYEKKKAMENENTIRVHTWNGRLCDFVHFGIMEEDIETIRRIGDDTWVATIVQSKIQK
ncbi:MAG TPA: hypothetical protein VLQ91_22085 [Draconibacterium sp.]|nr:hypothetical protein [Draconibacterium sp.]